MSIVLQGLDLGKVRPEQVSHVEIHARDLEWLSPKEAAARLELLPKLPNLQAVTATLENAPLEILRALNRCPNLASLTLQNCPAAACAEIRLAEYAPFLKLKSLHFGRCEAAEIPALWAKAPRLETLDLFMLPHVESLPESLVRLPYLRYLRLRVCHRLRQLPADWSGNKSLLHLRLEEPAMELESLQFLTTIPQLLQLELMHCPLQALPDALNALKNLDLLDIFGGNAPTYPRALLRLPALRSLRLNRIGFGRPPFEAFLHPNLQTISLYQVGFRADFEQSAQDVYQLIQKQNALGDEAQTRWLCEGFLGDTDWLAALDGAGLARLMGLGVSPYVENALEAIGDRYEQTADYQLTKNSFISILSTAPFGKEALRERLQKLGIAHGFSLQKRTTHVVLGRGNKPDASVFSNYKTLTAKQLAAFLDKHDTPFLRDTTEIQSEQVAHLRQLLLSKDPQNLEIALQMIEAGGLPDGLATDLVLVALDQPIGKETRKRIQQIIKRFAPELSPMTTLKFAGLMPYHRGSESFFEPIPRAPGLDTVRLLRYWFEQHGIGALAMVRAWVDALCDSDSLRASFRGFVEQFPDFTLNITRETELAALDLLGDIPLQRLVLKIESPTIYAVPESIRAFAGSLRHLEISAYHLRAGFIAELPTWLGGFEKLESLYFTSQLLEHLPDWLLTMPKLRELHLHNNPLSTHAKYPEWVRQSAQHGWEERGKGYLERSRSHTR